MSGSRLIAVDGANGRALLASAQRMAPRGGNIKGVSRWDASGLFEQLLVAEDGAAVSPRTLLLLYAADLAFRLRWEIEPALAEGHNVVAAPYVDTAVAFGRASGLPVKWLNSLFRFARRPSERHIVSAPPGTPRATDGFVEFASAQAGSLDRRPSRALASSTRVHLDARHRSRRRRRAGAR
jgi:hypothetical protein